MSCVNRWYAGYETSYENFHWGGQHIYLHGSKSPGSCLIFRSRAPLCFTISLGTSETVKSITRRTLLIALKHVIISPPNFTWKLLGQFSENKLDLRGQIENFKVPLKIDHKLSCASRFASSAPMNVCRSSSSVVKSWILRHCERSQWIYPNWALQ